MNSERMPELPRELKSLASDLASLAPASGTLRRDELMYRAGWAACAASAKDESLKAVQGGCVDTRPHGKFHLDRRLAWLWPLSTAGLLLVSAVLAVALATRAPEIREVVERPAGSSTDVDQGRAVKAPLSSADSSSDGMAAARPLLPIPPQSFRRPPLRRDDDYLALRERVLTYGVEVLQTADTKSPQVDRGVTMDSRYGALIGELRGG